MKFTTKCGAALVAGGSLLAREAPAQDMPKGLALMVEAGQGFRHQASSDDRYLATLQLVPQFTVVPGRLRAGLVLGGFYPGTGLGALAGGRLTVRVAQGPPLLLASSFQVHLLAEYLPVVRPGDGTRRQWVGGGIGIETSDLLSLAVKLHRDFQSPATYGQLAVALNLLHKKTLPPEL